MFGADVSITTLLTWIGIFLLWSAYFSSSETAMMALNRYRLRHFVELRHRGARKTSRLLKRPDRLIGVILLGNNLVNNLAAMCATLIGLKLYGDAGATIATIILTVVFLIFAETAPKTLAAQYPERIAYPSSYLLQPVLRLFYPLVWLLNGISNWLISPFVHKHHDSDHQDRLTPAELKTLLRDGAHLPGRRRSMMLRILELENVTVDDIMIPKSDIVGINLEDELSEIIDLVRHSQHTRIPVYSGSINNVVGVLHLRNAIRLMTEGEPTKTALMQLTNEPYYVPEGTPLHTQLLNFQKQQQRIALVVDEYGDIQGMATLEDILEEIVGEFTTDYAGNIADIHPQTDGSVIIDGGAVLRDVNRSLQWHLPVGGPRTLNGLILEHLEFIPDSNVCVQIDHYRMEILAIKDNAVRSVRAWEGPKPPEVIEVE